MRRKWWFAEIVLGVFLTVAVFGIGYSSAWLPTHQTSDTQSTKNPANEDGREEGGETFWERTVSDPVAAFTAILTLFTAVLGVGTLGLWYQTWRTTKLARDEFIATHRPKVIIRNIRDPRLDQYFTKAEEGDTDQPFRWILVVIVNLGESNAIITEIVADFGIPPSKPPLFPEPVGTAATSPSAPFVLKVGEQKTIQVTSSALVSGTAYVGNAVIDAGVKSEHHGTRGRSQQDI